MQKSQFSCIKPVDRVDIKQYKGFKCMPNNLYQTIRISPKQRLIEFNTRFMIASPTAQAHFLFEWAVRYAKLKDVNKADESTKRWCIRQGYDWHDIEPLYMAQGVFYNREHQVSRVMYLASKRVTFIDRWIDSLIISFRKWRNNRKQRKSNR